MKRDTDFRIKLSTRVEDAIKLLTLTYRDHLLLHELHNAINHLSTQSNANIFLALEGDDQKRWIKTSIRIFNVES